MHEPRRAEQILKDHSANRKLDLVSIDIAILSAAGAFVGALVAVYGFFAEKVTPDNTPEPLTASIAQLGVVGTIACAATCAIATKVALSKRTQHNSEIEEITQDTEHSLSLESSTSSD